MRGDCRDWRNEIEEGTAGAVLGGGAQAHLSSCDACRAALDEGRKLRRLVADLGRIEPPPDFDFRLRARLARLDGHARSGRNGRPRFAYGLVAAACFAALCALAFLRGTSPDATDPNGQLTNGESEAVAQSGGTPETFDGRGVVNPSNRPGKTGENTAGITSAAGSGGRRAAAGRRATARQVGGRAALARARDEAVFASRAAQIRTASVARRELASATSRPLAIPVGGSDEPLRVLTRDEHGVVRFVPTRSVSFGAQQIVARERGAQNASSTSQEGVW
jgi:hypothetical protein